MGFMVKGLCTPQYSHKFRLPSTGNSVQLQDLGFLGLLPMLKLLPLEKPLPSACNQALIGKVMVTLVWNNREPLKDFNPFGF